MTRDDLWKAGERYRQSRALNEQDRAHRNALIREALTEGKTHAWVAEATGLTRGRIGQMVKKKKKGGDAR